MGKVSRNITNENMKKNIALKPEAREILKAIVSIMPAILQRVWRNRIITQAEKNVIYDGRKSVSAKDILGAAREVMPSKFSPLFVRMSNPSKFKAIAKSGIEGYREGSRRWVKIDVKQSSAGKKFITRKSANPYILAICGSPRKGGNTHLLIDKFLEGAGENAARCETVYLHKKKIGYCVGCRKCRENNDGTILEDYCTIKDDMTEIYKKLALADAVVIGFPIYTARESAQTAAFWDRLDCMSNKYNRERFGGPKAGALITSWAWPEAQTYRDHMEGMMMLMRLRGIETLCSVAASGCRGRAHGRGVVVHDERGMKRVFSAGAKVAEIITIK